MRCGVLEEEAQGVCSLVKRKEGVSAKRTELPVRIPATFSDDNTAETQPEGQ